MMRQNERLIAWLIALFLAILFLVFQMVSCVQVRVVTGKDNQYEGSDKTSTGIDSDIKNTTREDSTSLRP